MTHSEVSEPKGSQVYLDIDNPGGGDCAFYSVAIGLLPILQRELSKREGEATPIWGKLKEYVGQEQEAHFIEKINACNIIAPDPELLTRFNHILRKIVFNKNLEEVNTWTKGSSKEKPQIIAEAETLFQYYLGNKDYEKSIWEADIGRDQASRIKIKEMAEDFKKKRKVLEDQVTGFISEQIKQLKNKKLEDIESALYKMLGYAHFDKPDELKEKVIAAVEKRCEIKINENDEQLILIFIKTKTKKMTYSEKRVDFFIDQFDQNPGEKLSEKSYPKDREQNDDQIKAWVEHSALKKEHCDFIERYISDSKITETIKKELKEIAISLSRNNQDTKEEVKKITIGYLERVSPANNRIQRYLAHELEQENHFVQALYKKKQQPRQWGTAQELGKLSDALGIHITIKKRGESDKQLDTQKDLPQIVLYNKRNIHWTTAIPVPDGVRPEFFQKFYMHSYLTIDLIKKVFLDYSAQRSGFMRFFSGKWNRHHLDLVYKIINQCAEHESSPQLVFEFIKTNMPKKYNQKGTFAETVNFLHFIDNPEGYKPMCCSVEECTGLKPKK